MSLSLWHPTKPGVCLSSLDSHPFHPGCSHSPAQSSVAQFTLSLVFVPLSCHQYPRARAPAPGSLCRCKGHRQHELGSPCLGSLAMSLRVVLVWVSPGQDPFELEERSKPQIPSWHQHPWRGGAFLSSPAPLSCLGHPVSGGGVAGRKALMFLPSDPPFLFLQTLPLSLQTVT